MEEADSQGGDNNDNVRRKKRQSALVPDDNVVYLQHRVGGSYSSYCFSCIKLANSDNIPKIQRCAYYLGALTNFIPHLFETAKEALQKMGYGVIEIHEGNQGDSEVPILGPISTDRLAAMIGQMILILYKNMNKQSYERYMKSRSAALRKVAGVHGDDSGILLSFANAEIISKTLRANHILRSEVLQVVISNADSSFDPFDRVSRYIMRMLEWTEMSSVDFICDTLLQSDSPVMNHARLAGEVANFHKALDEINKTPYPEHYRILHPDSASRILNKSRFPNLAAIATRIKMMNQRSVSNYVGPANYDAGFVEEMVKKHQDYIDEKIPEYIEEIYQMGMSLFYPSL